MAGRTRRHRRFGKGDAKPLPKPQKVRAHPAQLQIPALIGLRKGKP
jgi:hypothetical protein